MTIFEWIPGNLIDEEIINKNFIDVPKRERGRAPVITLV